MKIKGILVDVKSNIIEVCEIEKKLESYYKILNCNLIDIVSMKIGNKNFDIICDDEGLMKEEITISSIYDDFTPALVGNLFIVRHDGRGNERSLTSKDISMILENIMTIQATKTTKATTVVTERNVLMLKKE